MPLTVVPDVIADQTIASLRGSDSALDAAERMLEHDVSAIIVTDDADNLVGIITERDLTRRVIANKLDPRNTKLADVMTGDLVTVTPESLAQDALRQMLSHKIRHIPVVEGSHVVGVVSMRDLRQAIVRSTGGNRSGPTAGVWRRFVRALSGR